MSEICLRVGYSKATLYSYFSSKEELFSAVVFDATEAGFQASHEALDPSLPDLPQALACFGQRLLTLIYSPEVQAVRRLMVSEAGRTDLSRKCYELGPMRSEADMANYLQQAMTAGKLRPADPRLAARHRLGWLEAEWFNRFLFQVLGDVSAQEIKETVTRSVAVVMAAYGPTRLTGWRANVQRLLGHLRYQAGAKGARVSGNFLMSLWPTGFGPLRQPPP